MENNTVYYVEEQWALYTMRVPCCPHCGKRIDLTWERKPTMCRWCGGKMIWEEGNGEEVI